METDRQIKIDIRGLSLEAEANLFDEALRAGLALAHGSTSAWIGALTLQEAQAWQKKLKGRGIKSSIEIIPSRSQRSR